TAEGASVVIAGFVSENETRQLSAMEDLRDIAMVKSLIGADDPPTQIVLILTAGIVRATPATPSAAPAVTSVPSNGRYTVQVGAFQNVANAAALVGELEKRQHRDAFIEEASAGNRVYRVRVGRFADIRDVKALEAQLRKEGFHPFISQLR